MTPELQLWSHTRVSFDMHRRRLLIFSFLMFAVVKQLSYFDVVKGSRPVVREFPIVSTTTVARRIPIVLVALNGYQMGEGSSADTIPLWCERNNRVIILADSQQRPIGNATCVQVIDVSDFANKSKNEFLWRNRSEFPNQREKVFFDRWYVMRDWMRKSNTSRLFTMDSDAIMNIDVTQFFISYRETFMRHEFWVMYEPPRACWNFAFLTLDALEDVTFVWNRLFQRDMWNAGSTPHDMKFLGQYINSAHPEGAFPCWAAGDFAKATLEPGGCSSVYGNPNLSKKLREQNASGKFIPGTFMANEFGESAFEGYGLADKNYRHDPQGLYFMKKGGKYDNSGRGNKQLRFVDGNAQFLLRNASAWMPIWGYILEDEIEKCAKFHIQHMKTKSTCRCSDFCCDACLLSMNGTTS